MAFNLSHEPFISADGSSDSSNYVCKDSVPRIVQVLGIVKHMVYCLAAWLALNVIVSGSAATHYVDRNSSNPTPPYTNWATAAAVIQDAVDAADAWDEVVVTNGVYDTGGRITTETSDGTTNRVLVNKALDLHSVNGAQSTVIQGSTPTDAFEPIRCVYLSSQAKLSGFTLTNGNPYSSGGGIWCESTSSEVSNCIIIDNFAADDGGGALSGTLTGCTLSGNRAGNGGGAAYSVLNNCSLFENRAGWSDGGGAYGCTLSNCTVSQNWAFFEGSGVSASTLYNCIIYSNLIGSDASMDSTINYAVCTLVHCCTTPWPGTVISNGRGFGNITSPPLFLDLASGNLRLQSNSPCINAGNNAYAPAEPDLDRNPRIAGGTVDIGAFEFRNPASVISYSWLQQYGLPTDGSADFTDPDGDRMNNWQEWRCQTVPTDPLSALRLLSPAITPTNATLTWQSVAGVSYSLERSTNLAAFTPVAMNVVGQSGTTAYADTNAIGPGPFLYRVRVGN
jgi:hypothetical protein